MTETITIYCKNNNVYKDVPLGATLLDIYTAVGSPLKNRPMNARVNNKVEGLTFRCYYPKDVEFIDYTQLSGQRTYVRMPRTIQYGHQVFIPVERFRKVVAPYGGDWGEHAVVQQHQQHGPGHVVGGLEGEPAVQRKVPQHRQHQRQL